MELPNRAGDTTTDFYRELQNGVSHAYGHIRSDLCTAFSASKHLLATTAGISCGSCTGSLETVLVCSRSIYRSSESALAQDRSLLVKQPSTYIRSFGTGSDGMATHGTCTTGNSGPNSRSSHDCGCPAIVRAARTPLQTLRIVASTVNGDHLSPVAIFSTNLDSILRLVCPSNHLRVRFTPPRRSTLGLRDCCAAELLAVPLPGPLRFFI